MVASLTYADALRILGHRDSRLVGLLDAVASAGLAAWAAAAGVSGADSGVPLNLFELKNDVVRFGHLLVTRVSEWRSGLSRFDRTQRLAAAHAVVVVSAYFEAVQEAELPFELRRLGLIRSEQVARAVGDPVPESYGELIEVLISERLPLPECHRSYALTRQEIHRVHARLGERVRAFAQAHPVWQTLGDAQRPRAADALAGAATLRRALAHYDDNYRRLAADSHEFAVWASLTESHALSAGLAGVADLLGAMALEQHEQRPGERSRSRLHRSYLSALDEPVISSAHAPDGLVLPPLREAYVNPHCRVAEINPGDAPAEQQWWQRQEPVADVERLLVGFLTSPRATAGPLVVLGEPGSGKSKLTEVLAARLPAGQFLPVRVELRAVPAESMIHEQIENALYRDHGEQVSWHDLADAPDGSLPVLLLDGFDELLQASGVNRYDYLEQVRNFQRTQDRAGRPVAVIVTSRTVVADRARFPIDTLAIRLEPFSEDQIRRWLAVWNRHNAETLAARGLAPLDAESVLAHRELAEQPLLLMLLALFDATDNALQRHNTSLGQAELYRGLLMDFALREIGKSPRTHALPAARQAFLAERELHRLAIVALAMFARGRQSAGEADLDHDLPLLFEDGGARPDEDNTLSPSHRATGRFFFLHKSEATARGERARSYEFMHSTFGEFLIAWLTVRTLRDLDAVRQAIAGGMTGARGRLDDGPLYAILSFGCLAERRPTIDFLGELLPQLPAEERARIRQMLPDLIAGALYPHDNRSHRDYEPVRLPIPRRLAVYTANLTILHILIADEQVDASELFGATATFKRWYSHTSLWHGQFTTAEWYGLVDVIRVSVQREGDHLSVRLRREDGSPVSPYDALVTPASLPSQDRTDYDVLVTEGLVGSDELRVPPGTAAGHLIREAAFLPNWRTGMLLLQSIPFLRATGPAIRWDSADDHQILPGYLLAELDYARDAPPDHRAALYLYCCQVMADHAVLREQLVLRLRDEVTVLQPAAVLGILQNLNGAPPTPAHLDTIDRLWRHLATPTRQNVNTRRLVAALVSSLDKTSPGTDLSSLSSDLLVAARTSNSGRAAG